MSPGCRESQDDWSEDDDEIHPRVLFLSVGFILPMVMIVMMIMMMMMMLMMKVMIVVSYFTIWRTSITSSSFLKLNS